MPNHYDKVLRENFEAIFIPFVERRLNIGITSVRELPGKLERTLEREPDFLKIVETSDGRKFILQVEFQVSNDHRMLERMRLYHALLLERYQIPVRQIVLYLGRPALRMRKLAVEEEIFRGFEVMDLARTRVDEFLDSQVMGEVILAVLADFGDRDPRVVVRFILSKLQGLEGDEQDIRRAIEQLLILSSISNLKSVVEIELKDMPITIDFTQFEYYQDAMEKGLEKGIRETSHEVAERMLAMGKYSVEEISLVSGLSLEKVRKMQAERSH